MIGICSTKHFYWILPISFIVIIGQLIYTNSNEEFNFSLIKFSYFGSYFNSNLTNQTEKSIVKISSYLENNNSHSIYVKENKITPLDIKENDNFNDEISILNEIDFITDIYNEQTKQYHTCSVSRFKYLSLILSSIKSHKHQINRITSQEIDKKYHQRNKRRRYKIYNHKLYVSLNYGKKGGGFMWLSYLQRLIMKYGKYINNTDFVFSWNDGNALSNAANWVQTKFPLFISEGASLWESDNIYPLYFASRGWLQHEHTRKGLWRADCLYRNNIYPWEKRFNIAEFRGNDNGKKRKAIIRKIVNQYGIDNSVKHTKGKGKGKGFNIAFSNGNNNNGLNGDHLDLSEEIQHKFIVLIDGYSVRDGLHRQANYGSVLFKDNSTFREFWYFDLRNNKHVIWYNNVNNLIQLILSSENIVNQYEVNKNMSFADKYFDLKSIGENLYNFYHKNLWNTTNIDCFVMHMFQIYNHYFYNTSTIEIKEDNDREISFNNSCDMISKKDYNNEINHQFYCKYDDTLHKFCQFCQ